MKPKSSEEFEGFFVQARDSQDNVVGAFEILGDDGKYVTCDNKPQSTVTHATANFKKSFKVKWNAPSDFQGKIKILSTFVTDYSTYWVKVPSSDLEVVKDSETSSSEPKPEAEPNAEPEAEAESKAVGRGDLLYWLHGVLILVAWLGCAGAGMILAK